MRVLPQSPGRLSVDLKFGGPRNVLSYDLFFADSYTLGVLELFQLGCPCATFGQFLLFE